MLKEALETFALLTSDSKHFGFCPHKDISKGKCEEQSTQW